MKTKKTKTNINLIIFNKAMEQIKFSYNWNKKLNCKAFTTLRLYDPKKYRIGIEYEVFLIDKMIKKIEIIDIKVVEYKKINNFISYLDTGYSLGETKTILSRMYPFMHKQNQTYFMLILCKTI